MMVPGMPGSALGGAACCRAPSINTFLETFPRAAPAAGLAFLGARLRGGGRDEELRGAASTAATWLRHARTIAAAGRSDPIIEPPG